MSAETFGEVLEEMTVDGIFDHLTYTLSAAPMSRARQNVLRRSLTHLRDFMNCRAGSCFVVYEHPAEKHLEWVDEHVR